MAFGASRLPGFNFGLPQLGLNVDTGLQGALTFELPLRFGIHRTQGFYLDVGRHDEVQFTLSVGLQNLTMGARLGFLRLNVTDATGENRTPLGGNFAVDVRDPNDDGRLTLTALAGAPLRQLFAARVGGSARVGLNLEVNFGSAEFRSIRADFRFRWDFVNDGGDGNDDIRGNAGNDSLLGGRSGPGRATLLGDDVLPAPSDGNDMRKGEAGDAVLDGGGGDATLYAMVGDDTLHGAVANDAMLGGDGNDLLFGGGGVDTLDGDGGNDTLWGGDDTDHLHAGPGNDWL